MMTPPVRVDQTGRRCGKLVVLRQEGWVPTLKNRSSVWRCRCDCGNEVLITATRLAQSYSCGCSKRYRAVTIKLPNWAGSAPAKIFRGFDLKAVDREFFANVRDDQVAELKQVIKKYDRLYSR